MFDPFTIGISALVALGLTGVAGVAGIASWRGRRGDVVIFWDYEKCHIPRGENPGDVVGRVHKKAESYGTVKSFKAYTGLDPGIAIGVLKRALRTHKGKLITCQSRSKKEVVDRHMIVDMLTYACDTPNKAKKTTFILISGDGDFAETVMRLQERHYKVVIISPSQQGSHKLRRLGAELLDWKTVSGGNV